MGNRTVFSYFTAHVYIFLITFLYSDSRQLQFVCRSWELVGVNGVSKEVLVTNGNSANYLLLSHCGCALSRELVPWQ